MTVFFSILSDSFGLLAKEPKLFLPKIFVAFLYSVPVVFLPSLAAASFNEPSMELLNALFFWLLYILVALIVDAVVSAMYPFLVKNFFENKPVFISGALSSSLKKFFQVVPSVLLVELAFVAFVVLLSFPLVFFVLTKNLVGELLVMVFALAVVFFLAVFFFPIYPVVSLEKNGVIASIKRSIFLSKKNFSTAAKVTGFSFALSLASFAIAFWADYLSSQGFLLGSAVALLLFVLVRFVTALIATYQYVLSPVFYLDLEKGELFK